MYTEERLQRMGLSLNGSCHFCKENETLLHLFVHCKFVDSVWIEVFDKFNDFFLRKFNILAEKSEKNICLGIFDKDLNTILLSTKYFIWKERNVVKYQKKAMTMSKIRIINLLKNELSFLSAIYDDNTFIELKNSFCTRVYYVDTPTRQWKMIISFGDILSHYKI